MESIARLRRIIFQIHLAFFYYTNVKRRRNLSLFYFSEIIAALYSPEEYTVDPFLMVLSNLYVALHHGCQLHTRSRVVDLEKGRDKKGQKA